jgi:hypothetical protein
MMQVMIMKFLMLVMIMKVMMLVNIGPKYGRQRSTLPNRGSLKEDWRMFPRQ